MKKLKKVAVFLSLIILYSNNCVAKLKETKKSKKSIGQSLFKITKKSKKEKRKKKRKHLLALQGLSFGVDENTLEVVDDLVETVNDLPQNISKECQAFIRAAKKEAKDLIKDAKEEFKELIESTKENFIWYTISRGCSGIFLTVGALMLLHRLLYGKPPCQIANTT